MNKNASIIIVIALFVASAVVLIASVRGLAGTPNEQTINESTWKVNGPFELSPERGRYALMYSIIENKSLSFSSAIAQFATPDLGLSGKKYVSLFAPALSFMLIPGYLIGKAVGDGQVGAFAMVGLFALANVWLIYGVSRTLGAYRIPAMLAGVAFLLATPALPYAVTLYQHHATTFLLLLGIMALLRWKNIWSLILIWMLVALCISLDYPNFFIFFPLGLFAFARTFGVTLQKTGVRIAFQPIMIISVIGIILPLIFFLSYNQHAYGNPFQLAGTLPQVKSINGVVDANDLQSRSAVTIDDAAKNNDKSAVGFFKTRNMLNGLYIQFVSPDRGIIWYAPIVLLGVFGMPILYRRNPHALSLIVFTIGMTVLLYAMWGDPWGGWAFGSRYLIPVYALLAVLIAIAMSYASWKKVFITAFLILFAYGAAINVLGALTSNSNPPQAEVLALEKLSNKQQKYTYARNWDFLHTKGSKSFVYNVIEKKYVDPVTYYEIIAGIAIIPVVIVVITLFIRSYVRR